MTIREMDQLNVGDKVEVKTYNVEKEDYEWVQTEVSQIMVCTDGGRFSHGGYQSVYAKVNGLSTCLDHEFTRYIKKHTFSQLEERMRDNGNNLADVAIGRMMEMIEEETGQFPNWNDEAPEWVVKNCIGGK